MRALCMSSIIVDVSTAAKYFSGSVVRHWALCVVVCVIFLVVFVCFVFLAWQHSSHGGSVASLNAILLFCCCCLFLLLSFLGIAFFVVFVVV